MDESVKESSIRNSYEAPRTHRLAAVEASIKKVLEPKSFQSTIQVLSNATRKRKGEILTEPEAVKRLKSEMMAREKKKVAEKARLAPDLSEKKLQMGKRPDT